MATDERVSELSLVPIFIMGKKYDVPDSLTIQKALEYAGYQLIRGCGCRGGICGACGTVYRFPNSYTIHVGLACQTVVQAHMYIAQIPFFPANKSRYNLGMLRPDGETVRSLYPDILKCMGCNACTKSCPMDVKVMEYVSAALRGDIEEAGRKSFDCVMCGLCTARCPGELQQYLIGILCRRLYAKYIARRADHTHEMVERVVSKRYDASLQTLMKAGKDELKKLYTARENEPEVGDEFWKPKETQYL